MFGEISNQGSVDQVFELSYFSYSFELKIKTFFPILDQVDWILKAVKWYFVIEGSIRRLSKIFSKKDILILL